MRVLSDLDAVYIACALDCEGTFSIGDTSIGISISNTCLEFLNWIQVALGVGMLSPKSVGDNCKPQWRWTLTDPVILKPLVERLLPFFKIKEAQAKLILEYIDDCLYHPHPGNPVPSKILGLRMVLKDEMNALNKRGTS